MRMCRCGLTAKPELSRVQWPVSAQSPTSKDAQQEQRRTEDFYNFPCGFFGWDWSLNWCCALLQRWVCPDLRPDCTRSAADPTPGPIWPPWATVYPGMTVRSTTWVEMDTSRTSMMAIRRPLHTLSPETHKEEAEEDRGEFPLINYKVFLILIQSLQYKIRKVSEHFIEQPTTYCMSTIVIFVLYVFWWNLLRESY